MNPLVADVAKEALKQPISNFLDALLSPHITRLRRWAEQRDIRERAITVRDNAEIVFDRYIQRLLKNVSGINTIVFSQQVLPLPDVYEPVTLIGQRNRQPVEREHLRQAGVHRYIVDGAGMGKSTFVKHLILEEIVEGDLIPLFLELRKIQNEIPLIEAMACELDEMDVTFDRDLFSKLLATGQFLIILDGFDEVPSFLRDNLRTQIENLALQSERSSIILTSRPETALPVLPSATSLALAPFTKEQSCALVRRLDQIGCIDVGERLIKKFDTVPEQFLRTPLLVALLYRTFGFNNAISDSAAEFYGEVYDALYKGHDLTKSGFAREKKSTLDFLNFRRLLRGFAFLSIVTQKNVFTSSDDAIKLIEQAVRLTGVEPSSSEAWLDDLLATVSLLFRDGSEIRFLHKTIAEFFAAEFISTASSGDQILVQMRDNGMLDTIGGTLHFLSQINPALFRKNIAADIASSVLKHNPEQDRLLRSLTFAYSNEVGLWDADARENDLRVGSWTNFAGTLGGKRALLVFKTPYLYSTVSLSWDQVTENVDIFLNVPEHDDRNLDEISTVLPRNKWLTFDEVATQNAHQHPLLKQYLFAFFMINLAEHGLVDRVTKFNGNYNVPLLSDDAATKVLELVREENNKQNFLTEILDTASIKRE